MMATVKVCDVCGKPADIRKHLVLCCELNAAGRTKVMTEDYDLCWKHLALAACEAYAIVTQDRLPGEVFVDVIKAMQCQTKRART